MSSGPGLVTQNAEPANLSSSDAAELILDEVATLFFSRVPFALSDEGLEGVQPARR